MKPGHIILLLLLTLAGSLSGCLFNGDPAEEHLKTARAYASQGYTGAAVTELKKALDTTPDHLPSLLLLDKITSGSNKSEKMLPYLALAQQSGVNDIRILNKLVEAYLDQRQFQNALILIQQMPSLLSEQDQTNTLDRSIELDILRAKALVGLGNFSEAEGIYSDLLKDPSRLRTAQLGLGKITIQKIKSAFPYHPSYLNIKLPGNQYLLSPQIRTAHSKLTQEMHDQLVSGRKYIEQFLEISPDNLEAIISRSELYYLQSEFTNTIKSANHGLAIDQQNARLLFILAKSNIALGYYQAAKLNLIQLLAFDKTNLQASNSLAALYLRQRNTDDANELLDHYIKQGIQNEDLFINMGISELIKEDSEKALSYFKQAVKGFPDSTYAHAQLGTAFLKNKQFKFAINGFKEARFSDIGNLEVSLGLIQTNLIAGEFLMGLRVARTLSGQHPESPSPYHVLGSIYEYQNKNQRSLEEYEQALLIDPYYYPSRIQLAKLLPNENNFEKAEELLEEGLKLDPDQIILSTELALLEEQQGDDDSAIDQLKIISIENPAAIRPKVALGQLYLKTGNINQALKIKKELSKLEPLSNNIVAFIADIYQKLNNTTEALKMYQLLHERFPGNPNHQLSLGNAYMKKGDFGAARIQLNNARQILGDQSFSTLTGLAELELKNNNIEATKNLIKSILKTSPKQVNGYVLYGDLLLKEGKPKKAVKVYLRALKKRPYPDLIQKISHAYQLSGHKKSAKAFLKKWSKVMPDNLDISLAYIDYYQKINKLKSALSEGKDF